MKAVYACAVHNSEQKQNVLCLRERKRTKTWPNEEKRYFILCVHFSLSLCVCVIEMTDLPFWTKRALSVYCAYSNGLVQIREWQLNDDLRVKAKKRKKKLCTPVAFTLLARVCLNHQPIPDVMIREPSEICGVSDDDMNNSPGTRHWECSLILYSKDRDQLLLMLIKDDCLRCSDMFFTFKYYSKLISGL